MRFHHFDSRISLLTSCLVAVGLSAGTGVPQGKLDLPSLQKLAKTQVQNLRESLGVDANHQFALRGSIQDDLGQTHHRFTQTYQGVKVLGGELIDHQDGTGSALAPTQSLYKDIYLNVTPSLSKPEVLAIAQQAFGAVGRCGGGVNATALTIPAAELVILPETSRALRPQATARPNAKPNAEDMESSVVRYTLAYKVHLFVSNPIDGVKAQDFLINAHTGAVIKSWNSLKTAGSTPGTGNATGYSQYSGTVALNTALEDPALFGPSSLMPAAGFSLRDPSHGSVANPYLGYFSPGGPGSFTISSFGDESSYAPSQLLYLNPAESWGNGGQWDYTAPYFGELGQTAAVDAQFGTAATWDFYKNVFGRDGLDNRGTSVASVVHWGGRDAYPFAFWSGDEYGFFVGYGDGSGAVAAGPSSSEAPPHYWNSLTSLDIVAHELSHGFTESSANLDYYGEHGGLDEATCDIFSAMVEFYTRGGGRGTTIPATARNANFTLGEQIGFGPDAGVPIRWMAKPSLDGHSYDAWNPTIEEDDVHYSAGPMNRAFYFLSQGASNSPAALSYSAFLPNGMSGIGNDHAARIWYRTVTTKLTSRSNYWDAREGAIQSATELYGRFSNEAKAVANAFAGINVGKTSGAPELERTEFENNDTLSKAQKIDVNGALLGTMKSNADVDFFTINVPAGQWANVSLIPNGRSDYDLYLFDAQGQLVSYSEYGQGDIDNLSGKNASTVARTFYIAVTYFEGLVGTSGTYRLLTSTSPLDQFGTLSAEHAGWAGASWQSALPSLKALKTQGH